jgi:hypothetical protein
MVPLHCSRYTCRTSNIRYQICEIGSNPANCSSNVTVNVLQAAVDAIVDDLQQYHIQVEMEEPLHQY